MKSRTHLRIPARLFMVASLAGAAGCPESPASPACDLDGESQPTCVDPNGCTRSLTPLDDGATAAFTTCDAGGNCSTTTDPNGALLYTICHDPSQGCGGYTQTYPDGASYMFSQC